MGLKVRVGPRPPASQDAAEPRSRRQQPAQPERRRHGETTDEQCFCRRRQRQRPRGNGKSEEHGDLQYVSGVCTSRGCGRQG